MILILSINLIFMLGFYYNKVFFITLHGALFLTTMTKALKIKEVLQ